MKKIDFSAKKLDTEHLKKYFIEKPVFGDLGRKFQFIELIAISEETHRFSLEKIDKKYHLRIHQNFLINLASVIEITLKDLISFNAKNWNESNYSELLSEKISLENAYKLFKEVEVTREAIIGRNSSFNSIESIIITFNKLTTSQFVKEMENVQFLEDNHLTLQEFSPNWKSVINSIFVERNLTVHEGHNKLDLNTHVMDTFFSTTLMFLYAVNYYCQNNSFK